MNRTAVLALVLGAAGVCAFPAPKLKLPQDLAGTWEMQWGAGRYWCFFDEKGRYSWASHCDDVGEARWHFESYSVDRDSSLIVREGCRLYRWTLRSTPSGLGGVCTPLPYEYDPRPTAFKVELHALGRPAD